jgi:hypothetical protein
MAIWIWLALWVTIFEFELSSSFFDLFFKVQLIHAICFGPIRSLPKEKFAQYIRRTYIRCRSHSSLELVLAKLIYAIVVSVPAEMHNIHIWHTSPLIQQVAPTCITLCGQRCIRHKNVFTSYGSGHKTSPCLYSSWVRSHDSSHDECQPLLHDRDCLKQTSPWGNGSRIHITRREDTYLLSLS